VRKGLAEDVRYYGEWMKQRAWERIGHLYPKVKDENGIERTVIAWIWARTVKCPNPACGCEMPRDNGLREVMVSTDPPYYDNIGYADLSDFFYIWMRRALKDLFPDLFNTLRVPKTEELVATPYRFNGSSEEAKVFFEHGMLESFQQIYKYSRFDIPVTVYYAFKQTESDEENIASTGWETMLSAIISRIYNNGYLAYEN
jgi:adenine-specific DNA methylase